MFRMLLGLLGYRQTPRVLQCMPSSAELVKVIIILQCNFEKAFYCDMKDCIIEHQFSSLVNGLFGSKDFLQVPYVTF